MKNVGEAFLTSMGNSSPSILFLISLPRQFCVIVAVVIVGFLFFFFCLFCFVLWLVCDLRGVRGWKSLNNSVGKGVFWSRVWNVPAISEPTLGPPISDPLCRTPSQAPDPGPPSQFPKFSDLYPWLAISGTSIRVTLLIWNDNFLAFCSHHGIIHETCNISTFVVCFF